MDVEAFIAENGVDDGSANDLRACPPEIQEMVLAKGSLKGTSNPSGALIGRIKRGRMEAGKNKELFAKVSKDDLIMEIEKFIAFGGVDETSANELRMCPVEMQQMVLAKGSLTGTSDPSGVLTSRIRWARSQAGAGGGYKRPPSQDEIEMFIAEGMVDEKAANDFLQCPADVQAIVIAKGPLTGAGNTSGALIGRIKRARAQLKDPWPTEGKGGGGKGGGGKGGGGGGGGRGGGDKSELLQLLGGLLKSGGGDGGDVDLGALLGGGGGGGGLSALLGLLGGGGGGGGSGSGSGAQAPKSSTKFGSSKTATDKSGKKTAQSAWAKPGKTKGGAAKEQGVKVWVGDIPLPFDAKELKEHMSQAGNCLSVSVSVKKGQGTATYATDEEAQFAIAMLNGSVFGGACIQVDVWTKKE